MENMQALTGTSLFDFGLSCCAPSDLDPTPTIKGTREGVVLLAGAEAPAAAPHRSRPIWRSQARFGLRFGAKERLRHASPTGGLSRVRGGLGTQPRRWGRCWAMALAGAGRTGRTGVEERASKGRACACLESANPNQGCVGTYRAAGSPPWRIRGVRNVGAPVHAATVARVAYGLG